VADGAITDVGDSTALNIYAGDLRLEAGTDVGAVLNQLDVEALRLTLDAGAKASLVEGSGIALANLGTTYTRVQADGSVVTTEADAAFVSGDALGVTGDLSLTAGGAVTVVAEVAAGGSLNWDISGALSLNASVVLSGVGKTLDVLAQSVTMAQATGISTNNGAMRIEADAGALVLEAVSAGTASVALVVMYWTASRWTALWTPHSWPCIRTSVCSRTPWLR
jgi:hypothetical protein